MEQLIFDIQEEQSSLYNFTTELPRSWKELQYFCRSAQVDIPCYHKLSVKKVLTIPTYDFYKLKNDLSIDSFKTHILPMAVRYITKDNLYVIERPPFELEVDFRMGGAYSQSAKMPPVKIWVPWTVMIFNPNSLLEGDFSKVKLYFNSGPLDSMDQLLVTCFYPNTHSDSRICFSSSLNDFNSVLDLSQIAQGNIGYIYNYVFNNYMMGGWNSDLSQNLFDNFSRTSREIIERDCPTIKLFLNPSSDPEFYKKLSLVFPKKYFGRIKKYYDKSNSRTISREKSYFKNFGIFAAFTLEQTINFIKEIQHVLSLTASSSGNAFALDSIIKNFNYGLTDFTDAVSGVKLVTKILSSSLNYDYLQCKVDLFVINNSEADPRDYNDKNSLLPLDALSNINYRLIDFINTRKDDENIAFIYDYSSNTFDVILNYDSESYIKNLIKSAHEKIAQYCKDNPSANQLRGFDSWIKRLEERIEQYQQLIVT